MSRRGYTLIALMILACLSWRVWAASLGIGTPASESEIRAKPPSIRPDGGNLPVGSATAMVGRPVYLRHCASCHGADGKGVGEYPALVGGTGTLKTNTPIQTVGSFWPYATTVWDYINRSMPYQAPHTLKPNEIYGVTAYVLHLNGIVGPDELLSEATLPTVRMPNRDGFVGDPRPDVPMRSNIRLNSR